jgi:hypothetical protein
MEFQASRRMARLAESLRLTDHRALTIAEITPSHIFELIEPILIQKREIANRVRGRIKAVIAKNVDTHDRNFRQSGRHDHATASLETVTPVQAPIYFGARIAGA